MPTPKKRRRSLRPENFHLEVDEDALYQMFKAANEEKPIVEHPDPELEKLMEEYQKIPPIKPGKC